MGTGGFLPGNKQKREAYHWPAPSAEVKYAWSYTTTSSYVCLHLHGCLLGLLFGPEDGGSEFLRKVLHLLL
jgi:hypothetical protein